MDKNDLGELVNIPHIASRWNRKNGRTVVMFTDGSMVTAGGTAFQLQQEAVRLRRRSDVMSALANEKEMTR